jgi:hypothetical protein
MKVVLAFVIVVLSLISCQAQNNNGAQAPDERYRRQLVDLITRLEKNPWLGWGSGTEVVVRYLIDADAAGNPLGHAQPDLVYKVMEADGLLIRTQVFKGKNNRDDFLIKNETGLDSALAWKNVTEASTADMELDGFKLTCLLSDLRVTLMPGGTTVTREWTLASDPSIVLRKEDLGGSGWRVTSARVMKKIGQAEFPCLEIKKWMSFYSDGPNDSMTTQYLSPDVPGHLVEEIKEFFKVKKGQRSSAPFQVVHQKVMELRLRKPTGT